MTRRVLPLLLLLAVAPAGLAGSDEGTVRSEALNFEISMPDSIDWERGPQPDNQAVKVLFLTSYADSDPPAVCEVQLLVIPLTKDQVHMKLENLARQWSESLEGAVTNPRELKEEPDKLGDQDAFMRDVKGDYISGIAHITWYLTRMGQYAYVLYAIRTFQAVGDEQLEDEIKEIRDSFKFLKVVEVSSPKKPDKNAGKPPVPGGAGAGTKGEEIDPETIKKEKLDFDYWRFECIKPEGLLNVDTETLTESEKTNHVVAKFERTAEQTRIMIRVYAQIDKAQRWTLEQLAERYLKSFETTFPEEKQRLEPVIDKDYKKFPMAKEAIYMKLVGRRSVPETYFWYLGQCKNDRQYQIEIYVTGATGEKAWEKQIEDFIKGFKPKKK